MSVPKFRVGQVVYIKPAGPRGEGSYQRLLTTPYAPKRKDGCFTCSDGFIRHRSRMRPLTKREARR
jgi:hypothetical protein